MARCVLGGEIVCLTSLIFLRIVFDSSSSIIIAGLLIGLIGSIGGLRLGYQLVGFVSG